MKTIIKLLIAAAVINACARTGFAAWKYFQLKDEAQEMVRFSADLDAAELQNGVVEAARKLNVPLDAANVDVRRAGQRTAISAHYAQPVELFPGYTYPLDLSFDVDAIAARPITASDTTAQP